MGHREDLTETLDWMVAYLEFKKPDPDDEDTSPADISRARATFESFRTKLEAKDKFVPQALGNFDSADIDMLWDLRQKLLDYEISGVGFYQECRRTIEKMITLLWEQSPDELNVLSDEQKNILFSAKMDTPTEKELYNNAYSVFLGHRSGPHISLAMKFDEVISIQLRNHTEPGKHPYRNTPQPAMLAEKIKAVDAEYRKYFLRNDPRKEKAV